MPKQSDSDPENLAGRILKLLYPYMDKAIRPVLQDQFSSGAYQEEPFASHNLLLWVILFNTAGDTENPLVQEGNIDWHIGSEVVFLAASWLAALFTATLGDDGVHTIGTSGLDDAMLPPNDRGMWAFDKSYSDKKVPDLAMAREILRQVRQALPAGKLLPDEMVEFLGLMSIAAK
ncbi:MAG: hypothetical protein A2754_03660 [Candidatus Magasanikbacteria bacterium RIFCSPHIGHO2_01_FULL_47_8]|uniref:Uncharacterized protein n=1 Tax=Candidatus Magasanikbacteria bacterium RIFCSPHIGHO2_01_FULL_47_8 TaxID=1798673 RepID=A0A1F6MFM6_9BACT|nr:MAG: hypothetical protein A2754_03660 [Candidatus Magasanikbacteria bacterium RIFCSPHIGHO2_01_FULL_47_8]